MKIAGYQLEIPESSSKSEQRNNLIRAAKKIESEYEKTGGFDLVVLPELSTMDYSNESFANLKELAEDINGETFQLFSKTAKKLHCAISYGFALKKEDKYYISQAVISPTGEYLTHYNKIHIAQFEASSEKDYFTRGDKISTFELNGWKFGIIICYDIRFPELARELSIKHQIDFILNPVAFYKDQSYPSWHHFIITRALENQVYFLSINRSGESYGQSIFSPPWIDYTISPYIYGEDEAIKIFEVKKTTLQEIRDKYSFRKDRLSTYNLKHS